MDKVQIIINEICQHYGLEECVLKMPHGIEGAKIREIANARMVGMVLMREHTNLSLKSVGKIFGGRDHSTVIHAERTVPDLCEKIYQFRVDFKQVSDKVRMRFNPSLAVEKRFEEFRYAFI